MPTRSFKVASCFMNAGGSQVNARVARLVRDGDLKKGYCSDLVSTVVAHHGRVLCNGGNVSMCIIPSCPFQGSLKDGQRLAGPASR